MYSWQDPLKWKALLESDLPGEKAHLQMSPDSRGAFTHESEPVPAAVMVLTYPLHGRPGLVFIKRNAYDGPHSAQVSFPGGAVESLDDSPETAAKRETAEELGISDRIHLLGRMTPLYIPVSNFVVTPVAGILPARPRFDPDPTEVEYIIEVPVATLLDPATRSVETLHRHGMTFRAPSFKVGRERIWGATAMMLNEFLQLASTLP